MKKTLLLAIFGLAGLPNYSYAQLSFKLDTLVQSHNWKNDLKEAITSDYDVFYLDLSFSKFSKIPIDVYKFKSLKFLDLSFNEIDLVASEIIVLQELELLDLSGNSFEELPSEIKDLRSLKELHLRDHNLSQSEVEKVQALLPNCSIVLQ